MNRRENRGKGGALRQTFIDTGRGDCLLSNTALENSMLDALRGLDAQTPFRLFAYGSLMWQPEFSFARKTAARVFGYHRRFCVWSFGRGTAKRPGLALGLDRGGSCLGVVYELTQKSRRQDLGDLWRREMSTGVYRPLWVRTHGAGGAARALAFVVDRGHRQYAGQLGQTETAERIAVAAGVWGSCADYLQQTAAQLDSLAIAAPRIAELAKMVRARRGDASTTEHRRRRLVRD